MAGQPQVVAAGTRGKGHIGDEAQVTGAPDGAGGAWGEGVIEDTL